MHRKKRYTDVYSLTLGQNIKSNKKVDVEKEVDVDFFRHKHWKFNWDRLPAAKRKEFIDIMAALRKHNFNQTKSAQALGMTYSKFRTRLIFWGITCKRWPKLR